MIKNKKILEELEELKFMIKNSNSQILNHHETITNLTENIKRLKEQRDYYKKTNSANLARLGGHIKAKNDLTVRIIELESKLKDTNNNLDECMKNIAVKDKELNNSKKTISKQKKSI